MAFVHRGLEGGGVCEGGVHGVDCCLPASREDQPITAWSGVDHTRAAHQIPSPYSLSRASP